jgi:secondary thiamine-phosphate synthase enzyme
MLRQFQQTVTIATRGRGLCEITGEIQQLLQRTGLRTGLVVLHLRHTSASLLIQENADPDVQDDLERFLSRLVPDGDPLFIHTAEGPDDMPAHVRTALTSVNLSVPFIEGRLGLGTWQGIYLYEHRQDPHQRRVIVHFIGE